MEKTRVMVNGKSFIMEEVEAPIGLRRSSNKKTLTKEDVWGKFNEKFEKISNGMIVARYNDKCPVFKDIIPYKSVTVVCKPEEEHEVIYWLGYVQGGDCVSKRAELKNGNIALRADYQCW